jgi:hypothetical protein
MLNEFKMKLSNNTYYVNVKTLSRRFELMF